MSFDISAIRSDFPILGREVNDRPLVYLDNGASAQKPQVVIDAVAKAYSEEYSNVHRGLHYLSNVTTDKYEAVRGKIAKFLNSPSEDNIVFNSGTTEGINLVAYSWAMPRFEQAMRLFFPSWNITPILFLGTFCESVWVLKLYG